MAITKYYDEISQCNKCGFCQVACPIFRSTGHESGVARGRLALLRALIEGRLEWNKELEDPLFDCLGCGACTANCFPSVATSDMMIIARSEYLDKVRRKPIHHLLFDKLLPYPKRLHFAARIARLGKNSGLSGLARALGLLKIFGRDFSKAERIIKKIPPKPLRGRIKPGDYEGSGKSLRIGYFVGCGVDILQQEAGEATFALLKKIGKTITVLNNGCCGLPAYFYGDLVAARKLGVKNLNILSQADFDVIVTDCSSCASFLKKYPDLFTDEEHINSAKKIVTRLKDVVELFFSNDSLHATQRDNMIVTYHDPCHAVRGQSIAKEPRELLKKIPGIEFREMQEADWCCGGAGSYALSHYNLSQNVLDRKIENLKKTEANILVTSCPACMMQLAYGIRRHGLNTKVCHISQVMAG